MIVTELAELPWALHALRQHAQRREHYHWIAAPEGAVEEGYTPPPIGDGHRMKVRLPMRETSVDLTYTVDVIPDLRPGASGTRLVRHLSVTMSVQRQVTQGQLNLARDQLLKPLEPLVSAMFSARDGAPTAVRVRARALASIPVVDATAPRNLAVVHWRTPIVVHYLADYDGEPVVDVETP